MNDIVKQAKDARRRLHSAFIATMSHTDKPYPDDDRWTPWTRFLRPAMDGIDVAIGGLLAEIERLRLVAGGGSDPAGDNPIDGLMRHVGIPRLEGKHYVVGEGSDQAEPRKLPQEWAAERGLRILDPDGWREPGAPQFDVPCAEAEFELRVRVSTVIPLRTVRGSHDVPARCPHGETGPHWYDQLNEGTWWPRTCPGPAADLPTGDQQ